MTSMEVTLFIEGLVSEEVDRLDAVVLRVAILGARLKLASNSTKPS